MAIPNTIEMMRGLLEMIEPSDDHEENFYKGGTVSYETAKEFYDFAVEYIDKLDDALCSAVAHQDDASLNGRGKYEAEDDCRELAKFRKDERL